MKEVRIYLTFDFRMDMKRWNGQFPFLRILRGSPSDDCCYVLYKIDKSNCHHPIDAVESSQKGFVEGLIKNHLTRGTSFSQYDSKTC
jgi:hypothetical protein